MKLSIREARNSFIQHGLKKYRWWFRNPKQPPFGCIVHPVNNGINYQPFPQLVCKRPDFWLPSTVSPRRSFQCLVVCRLPRIRGLASSAISPVFVSPHGSVDRFKTCSDSCFVSWLQPRWIWFYWKFFFLKASCKVSKIPKKTHTSLTDFRISIG